MDPLSLTTSIVGLLTATAQVANYLAPYVSASRDTPKIVTQVHSEVVYSRTILLALEGLTNNLASVPVKRTALIQIDQLIAVFTDGVLLFSELEAALPSPPSTEPTSPRLPLQSRLQWARKESTFTALFIRLQSFKVSISLMLTILQRQVYLTGRYWHFNTSAKPNSDSDLRAAERQHELSENIAALLESNQSLSRRLMNLEDTFKVSAIVSKREIGLALSTESPNDDTPKPQQPSESTKGVAINKSNEISELSSLLECAEVSSFDFENDLEASRVYRRAQRDTMDFSFKSSIAHTNAWSAISSLSDVSNTSAIALPLYPEEIANAQHYGFGEPQALPATAPTPYSLRGRSLYQECLEIKLRLSHIPEFSETFAALRDGSIEKDPLTFLIDVFKGGMPLLLLLGNAPRLEHLARITELDKYYDSRKIPKVATFMFIYACIKVFGFLPDECFSISELMGDDTTGFTKVVRVINRVLDILTSSGDIEPVDLATLLPEEERRLTNPSPRDIIVEEFLVDERSYVANLERLLQLKRKIETDGSLYNDILMVSLGSLTLIVDSQRQFLLKMEMTARKPSDEQSWAAHFEAWSTMAFTYANFIASEKGAKECIRTVLAKRQGLLDKDVESVLKDSLRLLYLPSQHLPKYSGFLQELQLRGGLSDSQLNDVSAGIEALQEALRYINASIKDQELREVQADLVTRVQDWGGHNIDQFGNLLLFDVLDVLSGDILSSKPEVETFRVYLFEKVILFCKESSPVRKLGRSLIFRRTKNTEPDPRTGLKLSGRIYATSLRDLVSTSKPGSYLFQIFWKGGIPPFETIVIRFTTESKMKTWHEEVDRVRSMYAPTPPRRPSPTSYYAWMTTQTPDDYCKVNPFTDAKDTDNADTKNHGTDDDDTNNADIHNAPSSPRLPTIPDNENWF